ncbi:MAG: hypothetical protein RSE01_00650 [Akkermansia sp.]
MKPYLKNSLVSVTGISLINHPGLVFPEELFKKRSGFREKTGRAYKNPPIGGISTKEASLLFGCSLSGTRQFLKRKKVRFILVRQQNGCLSCFWDDKHVQKLVAEKSPLCAYAPKGYYSIDETLALLKVIRSTLYRLTKKGLLIEKKVRMRSKRGMRIHSFYSKSSVAHVFRRLKQGRE